jgi:hypothetical protein
LSTAVVDEECIGIATSTLVKYFGTDTAIVGNRAMMDIAIANLSRTRFGTLILPQIIYPVDWFTLSL